MTCRLIVPDKWSMVDVSELFGIHARYIQGIGNAKFGLVLSLLDGVVLRICFSVLFGIVWGWGFYGFVLGYGVAAYGFAIPSALYFLRGKWKKQKTLADINDDGKVNIFDLALLKAALK